MKVLVTGGAGFIGSHLCEELLKLEHEVTSLDNCKKNIKRNLAHLNGQKGFHSKLADVRSFDPEKLGKFDWIIHLAALADIVPSIENPAEYHDINVTGTVRILEFAKNSGVRKFIYAASGSCYGNNPVVPTQESHPIDCKYPYALTKYIGEQYVMHWHKVYGLPAISLRLFNVYGPRSRTTGAYGAVFGVFLAQKLARKPFTVVGNGSQSRDFVYVSDVVDGIIQALKSDKEGEIYNIGSGGHSSVNNLVNLLGAQDGVDKIPDRPGEPKITMAWIGKAQREIGFNPKVDIGKGVGIMLQNIDYWKDAPVWDKESIQGATEKWFKYMGEKNAGQLR